MTSKACLILIVQPQFRERPIPNYCFNYMFYSEHFYIDHWNIMCLQLSVLPCFVTYDTIISPCKSEVECYIMRRKCHLTYLWIVITSNKYLTLEIRVQVLRGIMITKYPQVVSVRDAYGADTTESDMLYQTPQHQRYWYHKNQTGNSDIWTENVEISIMKNWDT